MCGICGRSSVATGVSVVMASPGSGPFDRAALSDEGLEDGFSEGGFAESTGWLVDSNSLWRSVALSRMFCKSAIQSGTLSRRERKLFKASCGMFV